jgi:hypothetical protein
VSDGLRTSVNTVGKATAKVSFDVRATLPGLAKQSKRWTRNSICPICSGPKDRTATRCMDCWKKAKARRGKSVVMPMTPMHGAKWGAGPDRRGHSVEQPVRTRMVKGPKGWIEEEW